MTYTAEYVGHYTDRTFLVSTRKWGIGRRTWDPTHELRHGGSMKRILILFLLWPILASASEPQTTSDQGPDRRVR